MSAKAAKKLKAEQLAKAEAAATEPLAMVAAAMPAAPVPAPAPMPAPAVAQPAAAPVKPPPKPETAAAEAKRKKDAADAFGSARLAGRKAGTAKVKATGTQLAFHAGFGATNNQPPELKVSGRFGRIAAAAAVGTGAFKLVATLTTTVRNARPPDPPHTLTVPDETGVCRPIRPPTAALDRHRDDVRCAVYSHVGLLWIQRR